MRLKFLWPGRTKNPEIRALERHYASRIEAHAACEFIVTRGARGIDERLAEKIMELEARGFEKHLGDDYVICLSDEGSRMTSNEFAEFLRKREWESGRTMTFIVGGFLGLSERILARADRRLSLSRMTFSHELCRVMLLEQIYRALTINRGYRYAK